jgi:hypothetical protein
MDGEDTVVVSKAELEELRRLKADLPAIIEQAKLDRDKENLQKLTQRHKENPEKHRELSKRRYELKKDEILAKRREAYHRKKAANASQAPGVSSDLSENPPGPM